MKIWESKPPETLWATPGLLPLPYYYFLTTLLVLVLRLVFVRQCGRFHEPKSKQREPWARHGGCTSESGWSMGNVVRVSERAVSHGRVGRT